jgi:hypothetical protein
LESQLKDKYTTLTYFISFFEIKYNTSALKKMAETYQ